MNFKNIKRRRKLGIDTIGRLRRKWKREDRTDLILIAIAFILGLTLAFASSYTYTYESPDYLIPDPCTLENVTCDYEDHSKGADTISAYITGYNTVPAQTDDTPCIAADGSNICGRDDTVACPRSIELGTEVEIGGKVYECTDRLAKKYDNRFDINCDKDMRCPYEVTGRKDVLVLNQ